MKSIIQQRFLGLLLALTATGTAASLSAAPPDKANLRPRQGSLKVGDPAPDFTLKDIKGTTSTQLSKLRGKPVVLIFGSCT